MNLLNFFNKKKQNPKIKIEPINKEFEIESSKTILQSLLDQGVQFPHNCRVGSCTTCISKLKEGKVKELTDKAFVLTEEQLKENYILVCQSIPKSDYIVIENNKLNQKEEHIPAEIIEKKFLTHDIIELTITIQKPVYYKAGQYINFIFDWLDRPRSYSMSNRPNSKGTKQLKFFIRKVPKGKFTEWLFNNDDIIGTQFYVSQPEGNFYLRESNKPIIFIAGGSGLSPIFSILEDVIFNQDVIINKKQILRDVILLFGVRTEKDLYKLQELENFKTYWRGKFEIKPVLSEEKNNEKYNYGFVHETLNHIDYIKDSQLYMCGPPIMIDKCIEVANQAKLSSSEIFFDKFTDTSHILLKHDIK